MNNELIIKVTHLKRRVLKGAAGMLKKENQPVWRARGTYFIATLDFKSSEDSEDGEIALEGQRRNKKTSALC